MAKPTVCTVLKNKDNSPEKMPLMGGPTVTTSPDKEEHWTRKCYWQRSRRIITSKAQPVDFALPLPRVNFNVSSVMVTLLTVVILMLEITQCSSLEAKCPLVSTSRSTCKCSKDRARSGIEINIVCDFVKEKDVVVLTENLYPFRESKAVSAYVRIANATSVKVTQGFLSAWLHVFSVGLDLWNCGTVTLPPAPSIVLHHPQSFSTFVGIGLVGCKVPEIPAGLLRDRVAASLSIHNSVVGIVRKGVFERVRKVRYIVLEDSVIDEIEGSLAAEGYLTLSNHNIHLWDGLVLSNVTIGKVGEGAFNLLSKAGNMEDVHKMLLKGCQIDHISRRGITARGEVAVTIMNNSFGKLEDDSLRINVNKDFKFEGNVVTTAGEGAFRGLECNNLTKIDKNTIHIMTERNVTDLLQPSFIPFLTSCDQKQVFRVVNPSLPVSGAYISSVTWLLLGLVFVLVFAFGVGFYKFWKNNKMNHARTITYQTPNGVKSSARYMANEQEVNMVQDGISNPLYDRTAL